MKIAHTLYIVIVMWNYPDSLLRRVAYIEVAFQCNCHQGEGAARISNLETPLIKKSGKKTIWRDH